MTRTLPAASARPWPARRPHPAPGARRALRRVAAAAALAAASIAALSACVLGERFEAEDLEAAFAGDPGFASIEVSSNENLPGMWSYDVTARLAPTATRDETIAAVERLRAYMHAPERDGTWFAQAQADGFEWPVTSDAARNAGMTALAVDLREGGVIESGRFVDGTALESSFVATGDDAVAAFSHLVETASRDGVVDAVVSVTDRSGARVVVSGERLAPPAAALAAHAAASAAGAVAAYELEPDRASLRMSSRAEARAAQPLVAEAVARSGAPADFAASVSGGILSIEPGLDPVPAEQMADVLERVPGVTALRVDRTPTTGDYLTIEASSIEAAVTAERVATSRPAVAAYAHVNLVVPAASSPVELVAFSFPASGFDAAARASRLAAIQGATSVSHSPTNLELGLSAPRDATLASIAPAIKAQALRGQTVRLDVGGTAVLVFEAQDSVMLDDDTGRNDFDARPFVDAWNAAPAMS